MSVEGKNKSNVTCFYLFVYIYFRICTYCPPNIQARCPGHTPQLSWLAVYGSKLVDFVVRC